MHIVAVHGWQKEELEVAKTIAGILGLLVFEARQKIVGGGPVVLASFAERGHAEALAARLISAGVPAAVIDSVAVRNRPQRLQVRRFVFEAESLRVESSAGEVCHIGYNAMALLLVATAVSGQTQTTASIKERKFSLGRTLLAGGVPMSRTVTREETVMSEDRDETLWLYARGLQPVIFARAVMNYDGFGESMKLTRELNFTQLKSELRRRAPQAVYDERLLKRAGLIRVLGPALSPEADLDLALEILSLSLR